MGKRLDLHERSYVQCRINLQPRGCYYDNVRCRKNGLDGADRDSHHFGDCFDRAVSVREEARSAAGTAAADH